MREEGDHLRQQFCDIETDIREMRAVVTGSPFTSCGSINSLDSEKYCGMHLSDTFEYEFRPRTSSLLNLPHRTASNSPSLHRRATANMATKNLTRHKSLTHLDVKATDDIH